MIKVERQKQAEIREERRVEPNIRSKENRLERDRQALQSLHEELARVKLLDQTRSQRHIIARRKTPTQN